MFCKNCGRELRSGAAFCPACGAPVSVTKKSAAGTPSSAPAKPATVGRVSKMFAGAAASVENAGRRFSVSEVDTSYYTANTPVRVGTGFQGFLAMNGFLVYRKLFIYGISILAAIGFFLMMSESGSGFFMSLLLGIGMGLFSLAMGYVARFLYLGPILRAIGRVPEELRGDDRHVDRVMKQFLRSCVLAAVWDYLVILSFFTIVGGVLLIHTWKGLPVLYVSTGIEDEPKLQVCSKREWKEISQLAVFARMQYMA